jgi:hypothetical protein
MNDDEFEQFMLCYGDAIVATHDDDDRRRALTIVLDRLPVTDTSIIEAYVRTKLLTDSHWCTILCDTLQHAPTAFDRLSTALRCDVLDARAKHVDAHAHSPQNSSYVQIRRDDIAVDVLPSHVGIGQGTDVQRVYHFSQCAHSLTECRLQAQLGTMQVGKGVWVNRCASA